MLHVEVVQRSLPPQLLRAVAADADALAQCPNFWVPQERIEAGRGSCTTPAELAVCLLHQHVAHLLPPGWQGAEYWVQIYQPGVGLGFHFDKDEQLLTSEGVMVHPLFSSILYLTGSTCDAAAAAGGGAGGQDGGDSSSSTKDLAPEQQQPQQPTTGAACDFDGVRQAPTVILEQVFDQQRGCPVPAAPSSCVLVWPLRGSYAVFDGRLGHGVLDSCSSSRRATLLVNFWASCPRGVQELQGSAVEQQRLTRLADGAAQALLAEPWTAGPVSSTGSSQQHQQLGATSACNGGASSSQQPHAAVQQQQQQQHPDAAALAAQLATTQLSSSSAQGRCPPTPLPCCCVVAAARPSAGDKHAGHDDEEEEAMQLVDEVLEQQGLNLLGPAGLSAARFNHPGLVLCPITAAGGGGQGDGGGGCARLQTLAAFVSAVDSSSEDEEGSASGEGDRQ